MRLQVLDVFAKTAEEARIRTSSGGAVTLLTACVLVWLLLLQFSSYFSYTWDHALVIDSSRGDKMMITVDITFPNIPCELLSIDAIDEFGEVQQNLDHEFSRIDLDASGAPLPLEVKRQQTQERESAIAQRGPDYEGPCFGAEEGLRRVKGLSADEPVKCMTCADIHQAYAARNWAFHDGSGFAQCVEERFPEHLRANKDNGCRVSGNVLVSKVMGRIHFAPGESRFMNNQHTHDTSTFSLADMPYDFSHNIHQFSFGGRSVEELSPTEDPLQNHVATTTIKQFQYRYFMKVVGTDYSYSDGRSLQTNQYSVTHHERPLLGGKDADHPHTLHQTGGIPGVWFNYDISPMKVLETQRREQNFGTLLMNIFAIVGAVITTAAVVDKGVYAVDQALKARKDR